MLVPIMLVIIFTLLNGFFSGSEMAFINADERKLEKQAEEGDRKAKLALLLNKNQNRVLAVVQVAITLIGTLNSAFATSGLSQYLSPYIGQQGAAIVISLVVTVLTLIFGELLPKSIGQAVPETYSRFSAGILNLVYRLFKPVVWFLTKALSFLQSLLPIDFSNQDDLLSFSTIREIVVQGGKQGVLETEEVGMMQGVLKLNRRNAREVMVPRRQTLMLDLAKGKSENHALILDTIYSRLPVYEETPDQIVGFLLVKDYLRAVTIAGDYNEVDIRDLAYDPLIVPETLMLDDLFERIQQTSNHIAIVKDEYGQTVGIITLEDIIEEIVGEIYDESDTDLHPEIVEKIDEQTWIIEGLMNMNDFNEQFKTILTSNEVDTIGGYFILKSQIIPSEEKIGTTLRVDDYEMELMAVADANVSQLKLTRLIKE